MSTLLAHHLRLAAHGRHRCGWCGLTIAARERYIDQRIAENGTVWTWRCHQACDDLVWRHFREPDIEGVHPHDVYADALALEREDAT